MIIQSIHEKFNLTPEKITKVITDNGSNMVKAFKEFGLKVMTVGEEVIQLEDHGQGNDELSDEDKEEDEEDEDEEDSDDEDIVFHGLPEQEETDEPPLYYLPSREKCFSHTLSLICTTDLKKVKFPKSISRMAGKSGTSMAKVTKLWNKSNTPKSAEIMFKWFGKNIGRPVPTRWNSLFDCLTELLKFGMEKLNGNYFHFLARSMLLMLCLLNSRLFKRTEVASTSRFRICLLERT